MLLNFVGRELRKRLTAAGGLSVPVGFAEAGELIEVEGALTIGISRSVSEPFLRPESDI